MQVSLLLHVKCIANCACKISYMKTFKFIPRSFLPIFLFLIFHSAFPQNTRAISKVKGVVIDSLTEEAIEFAPVYMKDNPKIGTLTDENGNFTLLLKDSSSTIVISCVGYKTVELPIRVGTLHILEVKMQPNVESLNSIVVKPKKVKYRNKNNPSVELIQKVIENKPANRVEGLDFYSFDKYEKLQISLSD